MPEPRWEERLTEMEGWYRDLLQSGSEEATRALEDDYRPYAAYLRGVRGRVLDVGGGAGLAARFLDPSCDYHVLDPAGFWTEPAWAAFGRRFRESGPDPHFHRGAGEAMPFEQGAFDAAIAMWSLNHAEDPRLVVMEIGRVLKAGGLGLLVLEDMEPDWSDVSAYGWQQLRRRFQPGAAFPISWNQAAVGSFRATLRHKLLGRPWPLQPDHVRIADAALRQWLAPLFSIVARRWNGGYLHYQLERFVVGAGSRRC